MARRSSRRGPSVAGAVRRALERSEVGVLAGGALSGALDRLGVDLPYVEALGRDGTYGAALWLLGRTTKSRWARSLGAGLLAVGVADLVRSGSVGYAPAAGRQLAGQQIASAPQIGWGHPGGMEIAGEIEESELDEVE